MWQIGGGKERLELGIGSARHRHILEQLNRRLRNRMSGGVRGRGLVTPSYSINEKV